MFYTADYYARKMARQFYNALKKEVRLMNPVCDFCENQVSKEGSGGVMCKMRVMEVIAEQGSHRSRVVREEGALCSYDVALTSHFVPRKDSNSRAVVKMKALIDKLADDMNWGDGGG